MLIDFLKTNLRRMSKVELLEWLFEERFLKKNVFAFIVTDTWYYLNTTVTLTSMHGDELIKSVVLIKSISPS